MGPLLLGVSETDTSIKARKIPWAMRQNERVSQVPTDPVSRAYHALRKPQDLEDVGFLVILVLKIVFLLTPSSNTNQLIPRKKQRSSPKLEGKSVSWKLRDDTRP